MKIYFTIELESEDETLDLMEFAELTKSLTKALENHKVVLVSLKGGNAEEVKH